MRYFYYHYPFVFSKEELIIINNTIINNKEALEDLHSKNAIKKCKVHISKYEPLKNILNKALELIYFSNTEYFGYHLYQFSNHDCVNLNVYSDKDKGEYTWHMDGSNSQDFHDIKLTAIINTSDKKYEGGDFKIFCNGEKIVKELKPGSLLIFPSYYNHCVTPIKKGTRKSVSFWIKGPRLK